MCRDNSYHLLNLLVLYVNVSVKCLKFAPKWSLSYFNLFWQLFCYNSKPTVKVFNTWDIALINKYEEIGGKTIFIFQPHGGGGGGAK